MLPTVRLHKYYKTEFMYKGISITYSVIKNITTQFIVEISDHTIGYTLYMKWRANPVTAIHVCRSERIRKQHNKIL